MKKAEIINNLILALVGIAFCVFTLVFIDSNSITDVKNTEYADFKMGEQVLAQKTLKFQINERDFVEIMPNTSFVAQFDRQNMHLNLNLKNGEIFVSTLADDFSVSVKSDFYQIDSNSSVFFVDSNLKKSNVSIYAIENSSKINFIDSNSKFLNKIIVLEGNKIEFKKEKVVDTLKHLRLAKLLKEFQAKPYVVENLNTKILSSINKMNTVYAKKSLDFTVAVENQNIVAPESNFYAEVKSALTILPHAKNRLKKENEDFALKYALGYLVVQKNPEKANFWIKEWNPELQEKQVLKKLYSDMFFALQKDNLYIFKLAILKALYSKSDPIKILHEQLQDIENLSKKGLTIEAQEAYKAYQKDFNDFLQNQNFNKKDSLRDLHMELVELENLLAQGIVFYGTDSVKLLSKIESKILLISGSNQDLDEEKQAFVHSKIKFLEKLFELLANSKIDKELARQIAEELLFEAESYMSSIKADLAVKTYFEQKINDANLMVQFMQAPEFKFYKDIYSGLKDYKQKASDLQALNSYIQSLRTNKQNEQSVQINESEAISKASDTLKSYGIQFSNIVSLKDSDLRLFEIKDGSIFGQQFSANYDRETGILYDIIFGALRFSTGVKLEQFEKIAKANQNNDSGKNSADEDKSQLEQEIDKKSASESVALQAGIKEFEKAGFKKDDIKLLIKDIDLNLFSFELVFANDSLVYGDFDLNKNTVNGLIFEIEGENYNLPEMDLTNLDASLQVMSVHAQKN